MKTVWRRWTFALVISLAAHAGLFGAMLLRKRHVQAEDRSVIVELIPMPRERREREPEPPAPPPRAPTARPAAAATPVQAVAPTIMPPAPPAPTAAAAPTRAAGPGDAEALARAVVPGGGAGPGPRFKVPPDTAPRPSQFAMDPRKQADFDDVAEFKRKCRDYKRAPVPPGHVSAQGGGPGGSMAPMGEFKELGGGWQPSPRRPCPW